MKVLNTKEEKERWKRDMRRIEVLKEQIKLARKEIAILAGYK